MKTQNPARTDIFESIADEFTQALRNGAQPSIEQFADQHPQVADKIRLLFPMLAMMEHGERSGESLTRFANPYPETQPERLGDFLIEREIGRGGMGVVYLAVQESLGRRVALKLLAQNLLDKRSEERFEQEARVVANLHHTNIVPVYGIGQHEGYAYFVMQYIEGQSLDRVLVELNKMKRQTGSPSDDCISKQASSLMSPGEPVETTGDTGTLMRDDTNPELNRHTSSATGLVPGGSHYWINAARVGRQIASALRYAHSQKILHRDIKPSNLILDEAGSVWITDFGLARSFESDRLTRTGEVVGTLRYMPPEQMAGQSDIRSDVYGLGLTLYEMLTLRPANDESDHRRLIAQVTEGAPIAPRRVDSRIPRDLETIVLKCIALEPDKRYQSADEVHADLTRFICGEPVFARRISTSERLVKWARRRPAIASLAMLATLFAVLGVAGIAWKWREADHNFQESQKQGAAREVYFSKSLAAVDQMLTRVGSELLDDVPYISRIRTALLNDALDFYTDLLQDANDDPELQLEFGRIQRQIADIMISLGDHDDAIEKMTESIQVFERLRVQFPDEPIVIDWADAKTARAGLWVSEGRSEEAEVELRATIDELDRYKENVGGPTNENFDYLRWLPVQADAKLHLGIVLQTTRGNQESRQALEAALVCFDQIPQGIPDTATKKRHAECLESLAKILERIDLIPRSVVLREKAISIIQALVDSDPLAPDARSRLANLQQSKAEILINHGEHARALNIIQRLIGIRRDLARDFPFPVFRNNLAASLSLYSGIIQSIGDFDSALQAGQESIKICENLVADFPKSVGYQDSLARNYQLVATIASRMNGDDTLALSDDYYRKSYDLYKELSRSAPRDPVFQYQIAMVTRNWSDTARRMQEDDLRAAELLEEAIKLLTDLSGTEPDNTTYLYQLAYCRTNLGKSLALTEPDRSANEFAASCSVFVRLADLSPNDPRPRLQLTRGYGELAKLQFQLGDPDACEQSLRKACQNMEQTVKAFGKNANLITFLTISQNQLGHFLNFQNKCDEAESLFRLSLENRVVFLQEHADSVAGQRNLASSHTNLAWQLSYWRDESMRDPDLAMEHAIIATKLDLEGSKHWLGLAHVFLRQGEFAKTVSTIEGVEDLVGSVEMCRQSILAMAYWHMDQEEQARASLAKALEIRGSRSVQDDTAAQIWHLEQFRLVEEALGLVGS